jgi:hypothetical protein
VANKPEEPERLDVTINGDLSDASKERIRKTLQRVLHEELAKEGQRLKGAPARAAIFVGFERE